MDNVRSLAPARRREQLIDAALAAFLVVLGLVVTSAFDNWEVDVDRPIDGVGYALIVVTGGVLAVRRRWPVAVLAVAALAISSYLAAGYPYGPIFFSFFVAVYTVARYRPTQLAAWASAATLPPLLVHLFTNDVALPGALGIIPASAWVVVPCALGITVRVSREAAAQARADALRQHLDDERLRVAQDVHDVVGHGLAAIKMQADVALHVLAKRPEHAEEALRTISRTSSDALDELRATLTVVRRSAQEAARAPVHGPDSIRELCDRMRDAGLDVDVEMAGENRDLPAAVATAAYRVVQESLTNVLKHGGVKVAAVRVAYQTDAVMIVVSNPVTDRVVDGASGQSRMSERAAGESVAAELADGGPGAGGPGAGGPGQGGRPDDGAGLGISGMRRRVTALGGTLDAEADGAGRFVVRASIPLGGDR
ncbi:sensor histidine kinase [Phytoactinopolyspora halotolerans]|uniref:histidine kinase n=1 Tax=Phytoactinopolyspora halotolerans TaxID=1981512 RepID=A0A6L9S3J6_9ACTN|nr:histidine kinase [Phytoactinopolyspora halotolerans]NEE00005.1 sensor histidine kinase [Phytoactinopolyspora halotolerans]